MTVTIDSNSAGLTVRCECGWVVVGLRSDPRTVHKQVSTHLVHHGKEVTQ